MLKNALIVALTSLMTVTTFAHTPTSAFEDTIHAIINEQAEYESVDISLEDLDKATRQELLAVADSEKNVWYDTILEGDYMLSPSGKIELLAVSAIYVNETLTGYQITYSHAAWYTGECEWDYQTDFNEHTEHEVMKACDFGHIVGRAYVSPDFNDVIRDYNNPEEFE